MEESSNGIELMEPPESAAATTVKEPLKLISDMIIATSSTPRTARVSFKDAANVANIATKELKQSALAPGRCFNKSRSKTRFNLMKEKITFGRKKDKEEFVDEQKTFEDWVRRQINVRECCKFVKKKDHKDDPICKCGNKRSNHLPRTVEMTPDAKWDQPSCTTLIENCAFGKINFSGVDTTTQPQYMRIAVDNGRTETIKKLERLFTEFWKLNEPDLLISVTGGAKSFNVSHDICGSFQQGLLSAAKSTNAWLITGGQNCGVMKLVGDVIGRSIFTSKICTIGVGNWGKTWRREMLLNKNRHPKSREPMVNYTLDPPAKGFAALDPNHTHHFLVDDGTEGKEGIEIDFRGELESLICNMFTKDGVSLPMVTIMIEGGMQSIDQAVSTLRKGKTLVVLKGSGRASDILCYGFEHSIEVERENEDGEMIQERVLTESCRQEMIKLIDKDFAKYRAQGIVEKMITAVMEISSYRKTVTVFSIYNPEPLDFYILSSLMQSSAGGATRMRQMRLAITWGHARVAREFIFARKEYKFSTEELNSLLLFSIIKQRTEFVKLLIDYGANVREFVTQAHLTRLYNELRASTGGYRLLQEKRKKEKLDRGRFRMSVRSKTTRGVVLSDVGSIINQIMQGSFRSILCDPKYNERAQGNETFENPFDVMTIYSCLADCQSMALLFWESAKTPMATGLVSHKIYMFLDKMESKWARMDEEMTEKLENAAHEFEMLSCGLLTACYHSYDKTEWINILTVKMKDWGYLNLFVIANITGSKLFISHAAYQSYLTDIWMGNIHASTPTWKLLLYIFPPLPIFLSFNARFTNKDGTMKRLDSNEPDDTPKFSGRERLELYYTSPVIKFFLNTITYLIFLAVFMATLLGSSAEGTTDQGDNGNKKSPDTIGFKDIYTIVFVISTFPVELAQIFAKHTKSVKKKFAHHFKKVYNLLDFLAVILFLFGFAIKANLENKGAEVESKDRKRYNLKEFSDYHQYRLIASLCFAFYCFTFMRMFEINSKIGPKLFMLRRMSIDLFFFIFLLLVFTMTYCIASEALMYPFNEGALGDTIFNAVKRAYLNVFGDINMDGIESNIIEGHCTTLSVAATWLDSDRSQWPDSMKCPIEYVRNTAVGKVNYYFTFFLLCMYLLFVNIMLINLLIAIFSNTYADSEAKSGIIYKTQRAEVILQFRERPWLPNPLSLVYFVGLMFKKIFDKCVCKKKLYRSQIKKVNKQNTSFNAFRASLIEAECVGIFIRKKKQKAVSVSSLLEKLHLRFTGLTHTVENVEAQIKKSAGVMESSALKKHSSRGGSKTNTLKKELPLLTHPLHKIARISPYGGTGEVIRIPVADDKVSWCTLHEWYDPPDFTCDSVADTDTDDMDSIQFNAVDGKVDRTSLYVPYAIVDGDPMNPVGRTGLKGRGLLQKWGPNKFAVTVITRWARPGTGNVFSIKNKQVIEVLLVKNDKDSPYTLPKLRYDTEIDEKSHKNVVKSVCYDYEEVSAAENENVDKLIESAFVDNYEPIYKGYFDDTVNTDNAWVEVHVSSVHIDGKSGFSTTPPSKGKDVEEATWTMLNKKEALRQNDAWLLKLTCNKLHCYNPWRGEVLI